MLITISLSTFIVAIVSFLLVGYGFWYAHQSIIYVFGVMIGYLISVCGIMLAIGYIIGKVFG